MTAVNAAAEPASLRRNIAANYAGQIYAGLVGIAVVPIYLRIMGTEAYGLVGFFALLQAWIGLLDLGMSGTMSRETARYLGGGLDAGALRQLLRSLEFIFWPLGVLIAAVLAIASPAIAANWLKVGALNSLHVELALMLMGASISMRWVCGLYRGVVTGLERQVWLNGFNVVVASVRFLAVIPVLLFVDPGPVVFFLFQALVSVAELAALVVVTYRQVPSRHGPATGGAWQVLKPVVRFSAGIAFSTIVWVLVTQADKLIISALLPLSDYGYYTAAVLVASCVTILSAAISQAVLPRLTRLSQQSDPDGFFELYRSTTQWTAVIAGPLTLALASMAEPVLWAWTGDRTFSASYAPVLALYSVGNGFMTLAVFPYYLQFARGDLRLHVWGNVLFAVVLLPAIFGATIHYGAVGAGWVWALSNASFFFFWTPVVHRRYLPGLHAQWLVRDVFKVLAVPVCLAIFLAVVQNGALARLESALLVAAAFLVLALACLWGSDLARPRLLVLCRRLVR
jgi:O-antigen/teichoic acid export membrane protein